MLRRLYTDGNADRLSWVIRTGASDIVQHRDQAGIYRGKVSRIQAKFMALHVGLFWGIGVFAIVKGDHLKVMVDDGYMASCLAGGTDDAFIGRRIHFVNMLIEQKGLTADVEVIDPAQNVAALNDA